jgi:hypothetical protein
VAIKDLVSDHSEWEIYQTDFTNVEFIIGLI